MSIIWEEMKAQPTFSPPSPALLASYYIMAGLYTLRQAERKQVVRIIGMDIDCAMAWLPIISFMFHTCPALIAKRLLLSQGKRI